MARNTSGEANPALSTKIGHGLAKVLRIKLNRNEAPENASGGDSVISITTASTFVEEEPTSEEWIRDLLPDSAEIKQYFVSLFPFLKWITRYNSTWFLGDTVAGLTVGAVVVPQSMAYAGLAGLPPEFGLYSSFMGVLLYWFFATSKDITIGPVAVMSTLVGNIISKVNAKRKPIIPPPVIASALAVICGSIVLFIGLVRCGWIVDFIPLTAISAFMTGSAINIAVGQVPTLMGITGFNTRDSTYKVVINTLKHLGRTKLDAAMGLTALAMLYLIRSFCKFMSKRQPNRRKMWFFISTLRTAFVILLYTMISWLVNRHVKTAAKAKFKILGKVPRGFKHAGAPVMNQEIIKSFASELPAAVIVLLIEHIAISKSFGRINNYTINPSQELVAIGFTNVLGPFLGAYPATGSFSRTAIKSKAGVRTPFAGVITAILVLLAIYALSSVFFYIPSAGLSAVIIHAVGDLITPPDAVYRFWRVSPLEVIIFFAGVIVTVFTSIENGIYVTISLSAAILLFRVAKARGRFLGKVVVHSVIGDHHLSDGGKYGTLGNGEVLEKVDSAAEGRNTFLPIDHQDGSNPEVEVQSPYPGIFIYRFSEGFNYPNANHYLDYLTDYIFKHTRRTTLDTYEKLGDRPWNDPGPRRGKALNLDDSRPCLRAVILDFSSVNNVDITSVQNLIDVRNQLNRYTAPDTVEWHIACINNRWTKRALASAGFGYPNSPTAVHKSWKPIFSVAGIGGRSSAASDAERRNEKMLHRQQSRDAEDPKIDAIAVSMAKPTEQTASRSPKVAVVHGLNRPFFHTDLTTALQSAVLSVERKQEFEKQGGEGIGEEP
ncbi:MAG: Sulfate permease 2 [Geoglossum umbratile]|nr:MAG: Sulfate permease 2 [Geoglossum umbratile]